MRFRAAYDNSHTLSLLLASLIFMSNVSSTNALSCEQTSCVASVSSPIQSHESHSSGMAGYATVSLRGPVSPLRWP